MDSKLQFKHFDVECITPYEVKMIIDKLDSNKSTGIDGIGPKILKHCGDYITPAIAHIINNSILHGVFPDSLKIANVIPIFKQGEKTDPCNYRPISILPTISKVFERHIAGQIHKYFKYTDMLHTGQSGFRKEHSCQTALTRLVDTWLKDIDTGKYVGAVFLDLRKAFDLVDHQILLHKLKLYHFTDKTVKLLSSYLNNRKQRIKINGSYSKTLTIKSGVPQGSILGPLLFLIYINDISLALNDIKIDLYADDSTLYKSDSNITTIETNLQDSLIKINKWCFDNNMSLHPGKSKCMVMASNYKMKYSRELCLSINNIKLENVQVHKLLGIYIDNTISWKYQISKVCTKLNSKLALLKRISYYLSNDMKRMFYNAYIMPTFEYCCIIWGKGIRSKTCINKITKIQKRAARIILCMPLKTSSKFMFNELQWLSFEKRCAYHLGVQIYKCKNGLIPETISSLITFSNNESYQLRSIKRNDLMPQLKPRTNYIKDTFSYCSTNIWNDIPLFIRNTVSLNSFKSNYKKFLICKQFNEV